MNQPDSFFQTIPIMAVFPPSHYITLGLPITSLIILAEKLCLEEFGKMALYAI
jgi:hypothetical protein